MDIWIEPIHDKLMKTSKLHVTGSYQGKSPVPGEFSAQRASDAEHVSIWWRDHAKQTRAYCMGSRVFEIIYDCT